MRILRGSSIVCSLSGSAAQEVYFSSILVSVSFLSIYRLCDRFLFERDNRFAIQYESVCRLAVFSYSALGCTDARILIASVSASSDALGVILILYQYRGR